MLHSFALTSQAWLQFVDLAFAFVLSALIGLERQLRHKSAGLRTQAIVGTAAALFMLISKDGFFNVLGDHVVLDPSRVAAQVVSGIGFLGAGLILTRHGSVRGLTTAASVWETAAIGMAAGAGLWVLAISVTGLHFVIAYGFTALIRRLPGNQNAQIQLEIDYADGRGLLRDLLLAITSSGWQVNRAEPQPTRGGTAAVVLNLAGSASPDTLVGSLSGLDGVHSVQLVDENELE
ncbi:MAG: MgtC/SapB family protein [Propionicimonas sp.]|uniref:MgtC/SapB family protein n=1 Tax=Propionicimonas sp. TaxID=1955623 RepID=UPI002B21FBFF|nr:MgtC/SapB family protein [Propionicimonas sp.]MEA4944882.1 MgtC/SapB family protein [Propionicimonas sp.]MEA5117243.1 MgtC/SapB family protein [Propionicimonas sp.]